MSTPHFDFDATETVDDLPPTCTFTLGGKQWTVRNEATVPYETMRRILLATEVGVTVEIGPFFAAVLQPDQVEEFGKTLAEPSVTKGKAEDALKFVVGALYGRPTTPSGTSTAGRKPTGVKSAGGSSSQGTHKRASAG
jgi:hypothetical protein